MDSIERKYKGQYVRMVLDELKRDQEDRCARAIVSNLTPGRPSTYDERPYRLQLDRINRAIRFLNELVGKRTAR